MKKSDIALILGVIVVIIISIFAFKDTKEEVKEPIVLSDDFAEVKQISYDDYDAMLSEEKTFILVISREGCGYCDMYLPIIKEVAEEEQLPIYSVDLATFTEEESAAFSESNSFLKKGDWGTPTTLILKGSEVIDKLSGYTEKESVIEFFEKTISTDSTENNEVGE